MDWMLIVALVLVALASLATLYELRYRQQKEREIEDKKAIVRIVRHWFSR
jgi:type II secretory pathway pseudopilin PulG